MGHDSYADWLGSGEADQYEDRWVLLTNDYKAIDAADDPKELLARHPEIRAPFLSYVIPKDAVLIPTLYRRTGGLRRDCPNVGGGDQVGHGG
jgi:hypothetical protein